MHQYHRARAVYQNHPPGLGPHSGYADLQCQQGGDFAVYTLDLPAGSPGFVITSSRPSFSPDDIKLALSGRGVKIYTFATGAVEVLNSKGDAPDWRRF